MQGSNGGYSSANSMPKRLEQTDPTRQGNRLNSGQRPATSGNVAPQVFTDRAGNTYNRQGTAQEQGKVQKI